jgi:hypothetical protein
MTDTGTEQGTTTAPTGMQPTLSVGQPGTTATPGADSAPSGAASTQAERDQLPAAPDWSKDWTDDDRRIWNAKGKLDPNGVWKSYVNAEKLIGAQNRVPLPKEGDEVSQAAFRKAIGVPDKPADYKIEVPETSGDPKLATEFADVAHKAGLTPAQATALNKWWNEKSAAAIAAAAPNAEEFKRNAEVAVGQLKSEWGAEYSTKFNAAVRSLQALGVTAEQALKIEDALGTKAMITAFAKLGAEIGDGKFVDPNGAGNSGQTFGMNTAEQAQQWVNEMRADKKRLDQLSYDTRNNVSSVDRQKWQRAHELIHAAGQTNG